MTVITRRHFAVALGGVVACPLVARAQQQTKPIIGWLDGRLGVPLPEINEAFRRGLAEIGFLEGREVTIEYRTTDGHPEQWSVLTPDLVRRRVAVIFAATGGAALAAKAATKTIPIVFSTGGDPVELGLVASLNRPAGNLTGVFVLGTEVAAKRLELLHKLVPAAASIAMLAGPANTRYDQTETSNVQSAALALGLRLLVFNVTTDSDIAAAFATLVERKAGAVLLGGSVQLDSRTDQIISLAARYGLPTMSFRRSFVQAGGLLNYGPVLSEGYRLAGTYTGRILKGEKPTDLPVQLATRFEFIINLKTARAIRLENPPLLLALADEVIE